MKVVQNEVTGQYLLITGDERGIISTWDLTLMIKRLKLRVWYICYTIHQFVSHICTLPELMQPIPDEKLKSRRRGYHPRSSFHRVYGKETAKVRLNVPDELRHLSPTNRLSHIKLPLGAGHVPNSVAIYSRKKSFAKSNVNSTPMSNACWYKTCYISSIAHSI